MTSQAKSYVKFVNLNEVIFTVFYVLLTVQDLPICDESVKLIIHTMGILRVNAFSVNIDQTIATGLYWPSNFINHSCKQGNVKPVTNGMTQQMIALRDIQEGQELLFNYLPSDVQDCS